MIARQSAKRTFLCGAEITVDEDVGIRGVRRRGGRERVRLDVRADAREGGRTVRRCVRTGKQRQLVRTYKLLHEPTTPLHTAEMHEFNVGALKQAADVGVRVHAPLHARIENSRKEVRLNTVGFDLHLADRDEGVVLERAIRTALRINEHSAVALPLVLHAHRLAFVSFSVMGEIMSRASAYVTKSEK